jgi:hypothetical protein
MHAPTSLCAHTIKITCLRASIHSLSHGWSGSYAGDCIPRLGGQQAHYHPVYTYRSHRAPIHGLDQGPSDVACVAAMLVLLVQLYQTVGSASDRSDDKQVGAREHSAAIYGLDQ